MNMSFWTQKGGFSGSFIRIQPENSFVESWFKKKVIFLDD